MSALSGAFFYAAFGGENHTTALAGVGNAFPLWCLTAPPFPRKRGHYKAPLCCERLMKGVFRGVLFCPPEQGEVWRSRIGGRAQRVSQQNVFHVIW